MILFNGLCMRQVFGGELAFVFAELPTLAVMHYVLRISLAMHASSAMAVTFRNLAHNVPAYPSLPAFAGNERVCNVPASFHSFSKIFLISSISKFIKST